MITRFLIAAATLAALAAPACASTPSDDGFGTLSNGQVSSTPQPGVDAGNIDRDVITSPFDSPARRERMEIRPMDDTGGNNLLPPRMDASGVPDPRV